LRLRPVQDYTPVGLDLVIRERETFRHVALVAQIDTDYPPTIEAVATITKMKACPEGPPVRLSLCR
jgi:hypothetical protein